ncbi:MAG: transporter related [Paenibacillaceae bacterium]|nr:transporter related [Paenibacillaceae bacterium]
MVRKLNVQVFKNNLMLIRYVFRCTPVYFLLAMFYHLMRGVYTIVGGVLVSKVIIDAVQFDKPFTSVLVFLLFVGSFNLAIHTLGSVFNERIYPEMKERLHQHMQSELFTKAVETDFDRYNQPSFYNDFIFASSEADTRAFSCFETFGNAIQQAVAIVGIGAVIAMLDAAGLLFVGASFALSIFLNTKTNRISFEQTEKTIPLKRRLAYISRLFYLPDYAKEMRLHEMDGRLKGDFRQSNEDVRRVIQDTSPKLIFYRFLDRFICGTLLLDGIYLVTMAYKSIVLQTLSYGSMMGMINAVWNLKGNLQSIVSIISQIQQHSLYAVKLRTFLEHEPKIKNIKSPVTPAGQVGTITFENVSFRYEGSDQPVLRHLSFEIKPMEKVAIVGYNGAGKTTLVQLMLRLMDVTEGRILLDGVDIRNLELGGYRQQFGVAFQDFQIYAATAAENVSMCPITEHNREKVKEAMLAGGVYQRIMLSEKGMDTPLTREFDQEGINLSGGEAQKIAISRCFFKPFRYLIMDEPSSSLDPISEYELNRTLVHGAAGKSVIFISHRLSTTRMADKIFMMDNGEIIEQGSHNELMKRNGKYAEMFLLQAEDYVQHAG